MTALAMTVIAHPRLARIGDRALLSGLQAGREVRLSRREPEFAQPRRGSPRPLDDRSLSRNPILLRRLDDGGLLLDVAGFSRSVSLAGTLVEGETKLSSEELLRGVTLTLAGAVVLYLHRAERVAVLTGDLGIVGESAPVVKIRNRIKAWAELPDPVLILGETGTGKELVAKALAGRRRGPYVRFSIADIPSSLAVAELFGAEKQAYDGLKTRREGAFRAADGGTLFFDEIAEASSRIQGMLLRVLEAKEVKPLGTERLHKVDVRVLAATDQDLEEAARRGGFKPQLLQRLRGHELWLPPLRERREDLGRLFVFLLRRRLEELGEADLFDDRTDCEWRPAQVLDRLMQYHWPGNIRQLKKVTDRIGTTLKTRGWRADAGTVLGSFEPLLRAPNPTPKAPSHTGRGSLQETSSDGPGKQVQRRYRPSGLTQENLLAALDAAQWNYTRAAERLGVSRSSLYNHLKRLGLRTTKSLMCQEIEAELKASGGDVEVSARVLKVSPLGLLMRMKELGLR